jgi:polyisoprenoid-binding protein YceI
MKHFCLTLCTLVYMSLTASLGWAAPLTYAFDYSDSDIGFLYEFDGQEIRGRFPDFTGQLTLDFQKAANSKVDVIIDTTTARGGFIFATQALNGPKVLHSRKYPQMRFVSKSARSSDNGAVVTGDLTIRDVTRPVDLKVTVLRDAGTEASERDNLILWIETRIKRSDFNAGGYQELVSDILGIDIRARIKQVK